MMRIVCLERDSLQAPLRKPAFPCEWIDYPATSPQEIVARLEGAQIALVNKAVMSEEVLAALPQLRMIAECATGCDNIALQACRERGIVVSNVRDYAVHAVPEHTIMLMLAARRRLLGYALDVRDGKWAAAPNFYLSTYPVADLHDAVLAIVGRGSLGRSVAQLAGAFGMRILFAEHKDAVGVRDGYVAFERALSEADIVSLHCPLTEATRGLIGQKELALMKRDAVLINTARGRLVDEQALAQALRDKTIAGAAVDVLSSEPPRKGNPLLSADIPNLIITPHVAWASQGAMRQMAKQIIDNIDAFMGGQPRNRVV